MVPGRQRRDSCHIMYMYMRFIVLLMALAVMAPPAIAGGNLPTVYIETPGSEPVGSRDVWLPRCRVRIVAPDGIEVFETKTAEIKGRGHSTFAKPKKPLAMRFGKRTPLLGMGAGKRWVLLADFMDHSRLRNRLALAMARATGMEWTPACRHVDVVVNGRPQGCYLLTEQVRVARGRVDIDERRGVLLEVDSYDDGDPRFLTAVRRLPVSVKSPSHPSAAMVDSVRRFLDGIEQNLYFPPKNGRFHIERYLVLGSFADWWLVNEAAQNAEPNGPRSCYLYRDGGGLLTAGPVWDFDLAFITVGLDGDGNLRPARFSRPGAVRLTADSVYNRRALWYDRLLSDSSFVSLLSSRWQSLRPAWAALADSIDCWRREIEPSALADEALWRGQDPARFDTCATFRSAVCHLRATYVSRLAAMDSIVAALRRGACGR